MNYKIYKIDHKIYTKVCNINISHSPSTIEIREKTRITWGIKNNIVVLTCCEALCFLVSYSSLVSHFYSFVVMAIVYLAVIIIQVFINNQSIIYPN